MQGHYSATKAWTTTLAESLWVQNMDAGVDVLGVLPGLTATPHLDALLEPSNRNRAIEANPDNVVAEAMRALGRGPLVYPGAIPKVVALLQWILPVPVRLRGSAAMDDAYKSQEELKNAALD